MRVTSICAAVEIGFRFVGIWPGLSYGTFTWSAYMTSAVIALYFQYVYILHHFDVNNISILIDALSLTLTYSLGFLKLISLWSNRRIFYNILLAMNRDWGEVARDDRLVVCVMTSNVAWSRRFSNALISINATAAISYAVTNFMGHSNDPERDSNFSTKVLPIKMELPFEVEKSPLFEIIAIAQTVHEVSMAVLVAMMNSLIVTLVLHVSGQIDILRQKLLTLCNGETLQRESIVTNIKLLIARHQRIISFSDNIEALYSHIALMQFLANTLVICCIGLTIMSSFATDKNTVALLKSAIFYLAVTLEAFIFCFAGEYLSAKSKSIGDAVYESLWYNMTPGECRFVLFVILRSQKRLTITAGNIMDLSLEGFTSVMKASASYISVLHAMY
ncbi:odorant receptor 30a-like [Pseudomyrmex gracilis]|uniref:odorant receptor 30a-like n=1 Tax=Pseudomyrmex gracilis TaxID=219809 RepID=UPI000995C473|nr:odorant receptor 30a-like [Pseudomyrmex gracilis]